MIRKASLLVLLIVAAAPSAARANSKAKVEARARMDKATELYSQGKYAAALNELTIAYTLDPQPEMLYAIGQMHVQLGNCPQAILFYERFLTTNPDSVPAAAAQEAIDTCNNKPDTIGKPAPTPEPVKPPPPPEPPAWYTDKLGIALAGGGVVLGVAGLVTYVAARSDLGEAEAATNYQAHADLVDSAHSKRTIAAVLGAVGVGLAGAGVTRFVLVRRASASASASTTVGIAPAPSGGLVTWSGRF